MTPQLCAEMDMCFALMADMIAGTVSSQTGRRREGDTGVEPPMPGL